MISGTSDGQWPRIGWQAAFGPCFGRTSGLISSENCSCSVEAREGFGNRAGEDLRRLRHLGEGVEVSGADETLMLYCLVAVLGFPGKLLFLQA